MSLFMDVNETLGILYLIFLIQGWRLFSNILLRFTHPSICVCSASLTKRMKKQKSHLSIIPTPIHLMGYILSAIRGGEGKSKGMEQEKERSNTINLKTYHYYLEKEGGSSVLNGTFGLHIFIDTLIISLWRNNLVLALFGLWLFLRKVWCGPWRPHIISHLWGSPLIPPFQKLSGDIPFCFLPTWKSSFIIVKIKKLTSCLEQYKVVLSVIVLVISRETNECG